MLPILELFPLIRAHAGIQGHSLRALGPRFRGDERDARTVQLTNHSGGQILTSNCLFSFGFFSRSQYCAVSLGGRCLAVCRMVSFWFFTTISWISSAAWCVLASIATVPAGPSIFGLDSIAL